VLSGGFSGGVDDVTLNLLYSTSATPVQNHYTFYLYT